MKDEQETIAVGDDASIDAELAVLLNETAPPITSIANVDLDDIEHTLIVADAKAESYREQDGEEIAPAGAEPALRDPNEPLVIATPKPTRAPRVSIAGKPASEVIKSWGDEALAQAAMAVTGSDAEEGIKAMLATVDKLAKKVQEKAVNLLKHRATPANVQVYTRMGLTQLIAQGNVTSKQLVDTLLSKYKPGTARSQANQLMQLFPALGVAKRVAKGELELVASSPIVEAYNSALAAA